LLLGQEFLGHLPPGGWPAGFSRAVAGPSRQTER
jgi:hypothetical protein